MGPRSSGEVCSNPRHHAGEVERPYFSSQDLAPLPREDSWADGDL